jgi:hypothetical protein
LVPPARGEEPDQRPFWKNLGTEPYFDQMVLVHALRYRSIPQRHASDLGRTAVAFDHKHVAPAKKELSQLGLGNTNPFYVV